MNEKIKKIAEKAGLVRVGDFGLKRWEGSKSDSVSDQDIEKLILMVIEECSELTLDYKNDNHYNGWLDYRNMLKKHFLLTS